MKYSSNNVTEVSIPTLWKHDQKGQIIIEKAIHTPYFLFCLS